MSIRGANPLNSQGRRLVHSNTQLGSFHENPYTTTQTSILNQTWAAASLVNPHKSDCAIVALWYLRFAGDETQGQGPPRRIQKGAIAGRGGGVHAQD